MVWGTELTREQRREVNRQKQIERALAAGDLELAEMYRLAEYDDESTPEEDAEDARISKERAAKGKWIEYDFDNFDAEWEAMYPEDAPPCSRRSMRHSRIGKRTSSVYRRSIRKRLSICVSSKSGCRQPRRCSASTTMTFASLEILSCPFRGGGTRNQHPQSGHAPRSERRSAPAA